MKLKEKTVEKFLIWFFIVILIELYVLICELLIKLPHITLKCLFPCN